jgi:hypothetical protein
MINYSFIEKDEYDIEKGSLLESGTISLYVYAKP